MFGKCCTFNDWMIIRLLENVFEILSEFICGTYTVTFPNSILVDPNFLENIRGKL